MTTQKKTYGYSERTWLASGIVFRFHKSARFQAEKQLVHYPLAAAIANGVALAPAELPPSPRVVLNGLRLRNYGHADIVALGANDIVLIECKRGGTRASYREAAGQLAKYAEGLRSFSSDGVDWLRDLYVSSYGPHIPPATGRDVWAFDNMCRDFSELRQWQRALREVIRSRRMRLFIATDHDDASRLQDGIGRLREKWLTAGALRVTPVAKPHYAQVKAIDVTVRPR